VSAWVERLTLTSFRNYREATLEVGRGPIVLCGSNGAGKTNLLEAVSLLAPGQGLRRAAYGDLAAVGGDGSWSVAARLRRDDQSIDIGTGVLASGREERAGRIVRIDRETASGTGALADIVQMVWLLPAMDGLFTGPAGDRRRFLDRLILCIDPSYRTRLGQFERAMRQRNRLLETGTRTASQFDGLELILAETGIAIAAARADLVARMTAMMDKRRAQSRKSAFPWAVLAMEGALETALGSASALAVEDDYREALARGRERDRAAGRTLDGPHRSDFIASHGPKGMPARVCSTGEQKALLVGLALAHADLIAQVTGGTPPILLLDEIAAHLDAERRAALFDELVDLRAQVFMTGTDRSGFAALDGRARFFSVEDGRVTPIEDRS
jgi:DNA replication and repair protein RecF